jgi:hypothetical protein
VADGYKTPFTDRNGSIITPDAIIPAVGGPFTVPTGVPLGVAPGSSTRFVHFSSGLRTNYVSSHYKSSCRKCHNPHNTSFGSEQRKMWAESAHGNTRGLARIGLDGKTRGTRIPLDQNTGNNNYCVRCHTSTGFINFVAGDTFTDVNALSDIGADGRPDPNGLRSNSPEYTTASSGVNSGKIIDSTGTLIYPGTSGQGFYKDTSREATNCDVCHIDNRGTDSSSYSGTLRKVAVSTGVPIYYPYSTAGFKTVTLVRFDTLGSSNLCLTCHSGRATAKIITNGYDSLKNSYLRDLVVANRKPAAPSIHDFAGGAVIQGEKGAFLFYSSQLKYKTTPDHRSINTDGNGPCISCHMPKVQSNLTGGKIHSHLFRPVSWANDDINDSITDIISNSTVCSSCHNGTYQPGIDPTTMNTLRKGFRTSLVILSKLMVPTGSGPTNRNDWISTTPNPATGISYGTATVDRLKGSLPAAVYTMGASYNYGFLFNEPSSYNHSPVFTRQLIYDSIDWVISGSGGFGTAASPNKVYLALTGTTITGATWAKKSPIKGAVTGSTADTIYFTFANTDRSDALSYLCKNGVADANLSLKCDRWY